MMIKPSAMERLIAAYPDYAYTSDHVQAYAERRSSGAITHCSNAASIRKPRIF